jgi:iron complex outermembrane receptor protein/vitamin B12 transporter
MSVSAVRRARSSRAFLVLSAFFLAFAALLPAASIHGIVTDPTGARIGGAKVVLIGNGKVMATAVSAHDGGFLITTGDAGRYYLAISAPSFRQLETPGFYAGSLDTVERNLVLEPEWVRESIVVTATGTPTPQAQTSESTNVLGILDMELRSDLVSALRLMPGTFTAQDGQMGAQTSLFVRGGNSDANKILLDGVDAGDMGGDFDFGPLSTTAVERAEVFRGANSSLYGADAGSSVISLTTPHGTTSFPSLLLRADGGTFNTMRDEATVAGTHKKLDYLGAFSWLQTGNALPNDEYHVSTTAANLGWQPTASTQIRGTLHYGVSATGVPNTWDFYHVADSASEQDQNLFISGSIDNQTTEAFHNTLRYGATRKREENNQWAQVGGGDFDAYGDSMGRIVTITGANGYSVTGEAIQDYGGTYPNGGLLVNNRDQLVYQGDYRFTPHLTALAGFHFEDERGVLSYPTYNYSEATERSNYVYLAQVHGDYLNRFFYTLGGSLEHYSLFGTQTSPRAGVTFYAVKPRKGVFSGTRVLLNYGDAVREPKLTDEFGSLYHLLAANSAWTSIQQFHISPLAAPTTRTYEAGVEQSLLGEHLVFHATYFHNEFGKELEPVNTDLLGLFLPNLTAAQLASLEKFFNQNYIASLMLNSQSFRAQGAEATLESGIGRSIFLRGGYTYTDAVVQHSFTSDNEDLLAGTELTFNGIPVGSGSPLTGARPFRRPPHTGFFTATYAEKKITAAFTSAFASRSDDATFLSTLSSTGYYVPTMYLPNRNLDHGYAKLDLGGSYQLLSWLGVYGQAENLLNNRHIAPIGSPSLPFTVRMGLRMALGKGSGK